MKFSVFTTKSLVLASTLIFTVTSIGLVQAGGAGERDMPDEISPGDAAVRDTDGKNKDKSIKERLHMKEGKSSTSTSSTSTSTKKRDNSRYSTDGIERYEDEGGSSGTGPKREGRY